MFHAKLAPCVGMADSGRSAVERVAAKSGRLLPFAD